MSNVKIPKDIRALKFEEAQEELDVLIKKIDVGGMTLEDTTDCFIRCCLLSRHCHNILTNLGKKVLLYTGNKAEWSKFDSEEYREEIESLPTEVPKNIRKKNTPAEDGNKSAEVDNGEDDEPTLL